MVRVGETLTIKGAVPGYFAEIRGACDAAHGATGEANARLIAAAPDLLSALQAACDIIDLEAAIYSARAKVEHETANTRSAGDIEQKLNAKIAQLSVAIGSLAFPRKRRNELSDDLKAKVNYFRAAIAKATGGDL
jgi:hypothetical protein